MNICVLDIGGTSVKVWQSGDREPAKIKTSRKFTPARLIREVRKVVGDREIDRISLGYPGVVRWGRPVEDPVNLGKGWVDFDFSSKFEVPVRLINDADMQALGGYEGGRMLYLGLGTGIGTTLISDGAIHPVALGQLPYKNGRRFEDYLTKKARKRIGVAAWRRAVMDAAILFKDAMLADYVLLGGSGGDDFEELPEGCRRGSNLNAYFGGLRLWDDQVLGAAMLGQTR
jgi:hypothetical protein